MSLRPASFVLKQVAFSEAIWCTNSGAAKWLLDTGLALNNQGFIEVRQGWESF
ncbi:unnamed protein product, partial [Hapterophycus canaliculatus]